MAQRADGEAEMTHRIVVRYEDRTVCGFADVTDLGSVEELLHGTQELSLDTIRLRLLDSQTVQEVPTKDAKAALKLVATGSALAFCAALLVIGWKRRR